MLNFHESAALNSFVTTSHINDPLRPEEFFSYECYNSNEFCFEESISTWLKTSLSNSEVGQRHQ